jgi:hypothetical protein
MIGIQTGGITMTPLRRRMLEDMQLRGLAPKTQQAFTRRWANTRMRSDRLAREITRILAHSGGARF